MWATDLPHAHPAFVAGSLLPAYGGLDAHRLATFEVAPYAPLDAAGQFALLVTEAGLTTAICAVAEPVLPAIGATWAAYAVALAAPIIAALDAEDEPVSGDG